MPEHEQQQHESADEQPRELTAEEMDAVGGGLKSNGGGRNSSDPSPSG